MTEPSQPEAPEEARQTEILEPPDDTVDDDTPEAATVDHSRGGVVVGLVLVALGVLFLVDEAWPDFVAWRYLWPIALIAIGAAIVWRSRR